MQCMENQARAGWMPAEPNAAPDRRGMRRFSGTSSALVPRRQVSLVVRPREEERLLLGGILRVTAPGIPHRRAGWRLRGGSGRGSLGPAGAA